MDCQGHRRQCVFSSSGRLLNGQGPPPLVCPFRARAMLVGSDDGGVDHHVLEVGIAGQLAEHALPHARLRPAIIPLEHAVPGTELLRQLSPVCARPCNPEHSIDEQPIVFAGAAWIPCLSRQEVLDVMPLIISQLTSRHPLPPLAVETASHTP